MIYSMRNARIFVLLINIKTSGGTRQPNSTGNLTAQQNEVSNLVMILSIYILKTRVYQLQSPTACPSASPQETKVAQVWFLCDRYKKNFNTRIDKNCFNCTFVRCFGTSLDLLQTVVTENGANLGWRVVEFKFKYAVVPLSLFGKQVNPIHQTCRFVY